MNDLLPHEDEAVQIVELSTEECHRLLETNHFGRLGMTVGHQPTVIPVNYILDGNDIVVRTDAGSTIHGVVGRRVAFEIDGIDQFNHSGWSVIAIGDAQLITDGALDRARHLPLSSYEPGAKDLWVRLAAPAVTGRRIARP